MFSMMLNAMRKIKREQKVETYGIKKNVLISGITLEFPIVIV